MFRDPFEVLQSRYWHRVKMVKAGKLFHGGKKINKFPDPRIWIKNEKANLNIHMPVPVTMENYRSVIDNHFQYIGILEDSDGSMRILAGLLKKPFVNLPLLNRSTREKLTSITREEHKAVDPLNYAIYEYAVKKHKKLKRQFQKEQSMLHDTWQDSITITMEGLLIGPGWHEIEKAGDIYFRWTGPENESTLQVWPRRDHGNRLLNITIREAADDEILSGLKLEADGVPLFSTLSEKRNPAFLTAILPEDSSKAPNEKTVLTLRVPKVLPVSTGKKKRNQGMAIQQINIFPLSRSLFTAEKYNDPIPFDGLNYIRHNPGVRDAVVHGVYKSAYDYFVRNNRPGAKEAFELHTLFDERPGDLYDILEADMRDQARKLEEGYMEEIGLLREIVYRQGDMIRELKK